MKPVFRHITPLRLAAALLVCALSGCALYPAVQVAGGAMTGYDAVVMADDYIPRQSVDGGSLHAVHDRTLERRLRERLALNGLGDITAHVIDSNAYLLGCMATRSRADNAVKTAVSVTGLRTVTVKFYPLPSEDQRLDDQALTHTLTARLAETDRLKRADLRVQVIEGNAIIVGRADDYSQKTAAIAIAHEIGGIRDVVDYIRVPAPTGQADDGRRLAAN
ncbi:BON domain-containing protein [Pseudodesulfovibrio sp.]|uniref:BON domain-containing protein n=1 Tax=Pseudodesulfovibrio sp. TaxID=2035812 RepID=UPI0026250E35|nr:BON domain-containing protein [Pseudodesulfovibrio sp.]MDD3312464.1 BON domain-containing protein [Pseudodesulfovibrio sp.]